MRARDPLAGGGEQVGQVGAHVEGRGASGRRRRPSLGPEHAHAAAQPADGLRSRERHLAAFRPDVVVGGVRPLDGVLQGPGGLLDGQRRPAGQVDRAHRPVARGVAPGDLGQSGAVAIGAARSPTGSARSGLGRRKRPRAHDEMLMAPPGPLDENALALQAHQDMAPALRRGPGAVPSAGPGAGSHEATLLPHPQQTGAAQRSLVGDRRQGELARTLQEGVVDPQLLLRAPRPRVHPVHEGHAQPVVVVRRRDVNGAAHGPGAHESPGLEGRLDVGASGSRRSGDDRVGHGGDLLALDGELTAHRLGGRGRRRRLHEPLGDQPQVGHLPRSADLRHRLRDHGDGTTQKRREEGSSRPRMAS